MVDVVVGGCMKTQSDSLKLLADRLFWLVTWHLASTDMPLTSEMTVTQSDVLTIC
jgi:hypothetical protein